MYNALAKPNEPWFDRSAMIAFQRDQDIKRFIWEVKMKYNINITYEEAEVYMINEGRLEPIIKEPSKN